MSTTGPRYAILAFAAVLALAAICASTHAAEVHRILPLGDSITQAEADRASYRYPLWRMLIDAGLEFEFVGSMSTHLGEPRAGSPPQPDYRGRSFDPDHEGHFGWTTTDILDGRGFAGGSGTGRLTDWIERYTADIALVHLGTNDAFAASDHKATAGNIERIIRLLREDNPEIAVLLAKLIPVRKVEENGPIDSLNREIARVARAMHTDRSPVIIVDQYRGFDPVEDTYDGVHPNASGERKIAERWFDAIMALVGKNG